MEIKKISPQDIDRTNVLQALYLIKPFDEAPYVSPLYHCYDGQEMVYCFMHPRIGTWTHIDKTDEIYLLNW